MFDQVQEVQKMKSKIEVLNKIQNKPDKFLKRPEQTKYSEDNFKQKVEFQDRERRRIEKAKESCGYSLDKIIHDQCEDFLESYSKLARRVNQIKKANEMRQQLETASNH